AFLPENWLVNEHQTPKFSENGQQLFFGISPRPILEDTTLLDDERVKVEVWHWNDAQLYTQQEVRQKREEKRAYSAVWHPATGQFVQLGSEKIPEIRMGDEGNAIKVLGYNAEPYEKVTSWEGGPAGKDLYIIDTKTGSQKNIGKRVKGSPRLSPSAKFVYAYLPADSAWYTYAVEDGKTMQLTNNQKIAFYDELNDRPMHPYSYGMAGWANNDQYVLIYDRYDIWQFDPKGLEQPKNLTNGRIQKRRYRYLRLDREERFIDTNKKLLLHVFDETTKESGYSYLDVQTGKLTQLVFGKYAHTRRPLKAKDADKIVFTKGNFETFPDLQYTDATFKNIKQISIANPQQKEYRWGTMELFEWTSLDGQKLKGLLVKPENFDPTKKYPMIVNFYERNSDRLYQHKPPSAGRSTINYPFYASRGYVIFNPDIPYEVGYPGRSCYNAVVSGTQAVIRQGFVDEARIGVQGHSWGGYQIAHLLTKTDLFKCAESGAPVVNMFSAYGGIRWGSGLSRMFQYEHTQSRIGGTIWDYRDRYIENSPIFELNKTNTPVLILHNDEDTAVPWYQGIEYFVGLRRLGKPAWLLNYNGEPHWPVKLANRKDFNIRMQQFFDHYLQGAAMPSWMESGVSPIEKGKVQGLELVKE
ncbi:MAG: prolyl oligopeptidase family serine peptidase, partial [Bacteroidota bacterium]